jgi:hypothetical protein
MVRLMAERKIHEQDGEIPGNPDVATALGYDVAAALEEPDGP